MRNIHRKVAVTLAHYPLLWAGARIYFFERSLAVYTQYQRNQDIHSHKHLDCWGLTGLGVWEYLGRLTTTSMALWRRSFDTRSWICTGWCRCVLQAGQWLASLLERSPWMKLFSDGCCRPIHTCSLAAGTPLKVDERTEGIGRQPASSRLANVFVPRCGEWLCLV